VYVYVCVCVCVCMCGVCVCVCVCVYSEFDVKNSNVNAASHFISHSPLTNTRTDTTDPVNTEADGKSFVFV